MLFIHILFLFFMCHSHLYFSFNTLLMPQWIKIQSLLEINNTQNIQRILEYFTVRVPKASSLLRRKRPEEDRGHTPTTHTDAPWLSSIPTVTWSRLCGGWDGGWSSYAECISDRPVLHATMQYHSTPAEGVTLNTHGKVSFQILPLITDWEVCTKRDGGFWVYLLFFFAFFPQRYNLI